MWGTIMWWIIVLSIGAGVLYRMGGAKGFDTKYRDLGCPLIFILSLLILGIRAQWWAWFFSVGIMWGAMSTYCKFGDQENVKWYNWVCTGLFYGSSAILFVFSNSIGIIPFALRTIVLGITITAWSELMGWDVGEEFGRGFLFNISVLLLII